MSVQTKEALLEEKAVAEVKLEDIARFISRPNTSISQISVYTMQYAQVDAQLNRVRFKLTELKGK